MTELERQRRTREADYERDEVRGTPGRSTLTSRLPPTARSIAREVANQLQVQAKGDLEGPDVHAVAADGLTGSSLTLPYLEEIQRAFGHHDVSGVRAHVGGSAAAAAGALGARGYAVGDSIAFAAAPDLHLAAHEAAHVVQQRGGVRLAGGVGRAGDEYEQHADAVADLVVRGESAQALLDQRAHRGAAGGSALQRDEEADLAWLERLHHDGHGHWTAADGRELSPGEQRRLRRVLGAGAARTPRSEMTGTVAAPERSEGAHPEVATERTSVDEDREATADATGTSHGSTLGDVTDFAAGGRRRSTETLEDGTEARVDHITETRRRITSEGVVTRTERGRRAEALHGPTLAIELHDELEERLAQVRRDQLAAPPGSRRAFRERRLRLEADIRALSAPGVSTADATAIAERHHVPIVSEEDVTTETATLDVNPLDGRVGRGSRTERDVHDADGSSGRTVDHTSTVADLSAGSLEHRRDEEVSATTSDGSRMTERTSRSVRGEVDDGRAEVTRRTRSESDDTSAAGARTRTATEHSTSAGAIVTPDETGGRIGHTTRSEVETGGLSSARETSGAVEVTDRRVGGSGSHSREARRGDVRATARVSGDGSFSIDVTPIEDGSGRFRLTFTIHAGVAASVSASRRRESGDGGRGSASVRGSAAGDLITARVISEDEARRYLDASDRAERGQPVSDPPEFGRLERLRAAGEGADALLESGAILGSGDSASAMQDGDSITLDTEVGIGGDASVGGARGSVGGDVEAGGDARWRRTVQVERTTVGGQPCVRVTVTYHEETEWHAGGTASARGAGAARVRYGEESGVTDAVQFALDPSSADYDARYRRIVGTTDRDQLRALEREYAGDVRRSRHGESSAEDLEHEVGPTSEAMLGMRSHGERSEDISTVYDADGTAVALEGHVEGGNEEDVRARVHGTDVDLGGHREDVRAELDENGMSVDVEAREQQIDPAAALRDGADAWSRADGRERAAMVMARSPTEHLTHALREFDHRWGYHLDEADLSRMADRAGDVSRWMACCIVPDRGVLVKWRSLRAALAHPHPDAAEAAVDANAALNLARARALSTWMQGASGHGAECIEHVLRRWGETTTHEVSDDRLGRGFEWPPSLRHASASYTTLHAQAADMRDRLDRALARPAGNTEAEAYFGEVSTGLDTVLRQVRACSDFQSEARRSELIREIEQQRAEVHVKYRNFQRRWTELHAAGEEGATPTTEEIARTRASGADMTAERSRAYVRAAIRVLQDNHARETRMLQAVQAVLPPDDLGPGLGESARAEAATLCSQVHDLHRTWIQQVQDLRQSYTQAGTPEAQWQVSTSPGARRNRQFEPNVGWLVGEYRRTMQHSYDPYWESRIAQWQQEGNEY